MHAGIQMMAISRKSDADVTFAMGKTRWTLRVLRWFFLVCLNARILLAMHA
jgi:hypothetical protein